MILFRIVLHVMYVLELLFLVISGICLFIPAVIIPSTIIERTFIAWGDSVADRIEFNKTKIKKSWM